MMVDSIKDESLAKGCEGLLVVFFHKFDLLDLIIYITGIIFINIEI